MGKAVKRLTKIFLFLWILLVLLSLGCWYLTANYVLLNGRLYSRNAEELCFFGEEIPDLDVLSQLDRLKKLDLRNTGLTLGAHEWLKNRLPACEILWEIQIDGQSCRPDAEKIALSSLTESDLVTLDFLTELREIDARNCKDYALLAKLSKRRPQCRILCEIELGNRCWNQDTRALILKDADMNQLLGRLDALPHVKRVLFTGTLPTTEQLNLFRARFPEIETNWQVELYGKILRKDQENLDLTLQKVPDAEELRKTLLYFPYLKTLDFRGTPVSPDDRAYLQKYYPQVEMIWDVEFDGAAFPVETEVLDLTGHENLQLEQIRAAVPYLPHLKKVILCNCGLPNEELAAFRDSLPEIRVVWNVQVGGRDTRTDETYFAPNKWGLKLDNKNLYDLRYCTDMVCVDVGHAKNVTNCQWAEFMPELRFLVLADTGVRDLTPLQNLKKLKFLELFLLPGQDLTPLQGCTALEDLNLCYVYADPAPIEKMTWLKRLWWSGCWPAKHRLENQLPNTEKNFKAKSSTGDGWREGKYYYEMRDYIGMGYMKG